MPKILAIDDKQDNLITISAFLKNLIPNCTVITSDSGTEGIKKAEAEQPDAILLDIKMPEMDGYEVCRHLKSNEKTKHIPVIMVTAIRTDSQSRVKGLEIGADAFLSKPIDEIELVAQIKVMLRIKKAEDILRKEKDLLEDTVQERTRALRESGEKYRLMFETMVSGFALLEMMYDESGKPMDCRYLEANPAHEKLTGLKTSEIIDRTARESIPGLEDSWIENYAQVDRTGKPMEIENYVEGLKSWYKVFAYRTKPGFVAVTFENITDSKRAEETLKTREQAIASSINGINFTDLQGNFIYANNSFLKMWGFKTEDDLIGRNISDLWADQNRFQEAFNEFQKKGSYLGELEAKEQDGTKFDVQLSATTVKGERGEPLFLMASFVDITQRNQAHQALRESEEKYRLLIENATDAIFIAQDEVLKFANPKAKKITGYSAEELAKIPFVDIIHPEDRDMILERHMKRLKGEKIPSIYSFRILNKSGEELSVELNAVLINWEGRPATLNFLRDITAQKRLEDQLQQAQKMEAIGTLAGGIAHDFNNILGGIIGYAELAKMKVPEGSNVIAYLDKMIKSSDRAADLIKQILTLSRQHKQKQRPVQVRHIIKETLSLLRATLPTTIEIRHDLAKDAGVVNADPTQMHQVIMNLATNAGHAMQENGGVLEVTLANVELDDLSAEKHLDLAAGSYLRLTVSDTGHGMTSEIMERIFDPYFTTKDAGEGTGLGLSVAHSIVKTHGGTITVYSEPGEGTTFHVYLPLILDEEREEKESEEPLPTGTERILFIDDEEVLLEIGSQILEQLGYEVVTKQSSVQALELFRAEPDRFDLVITDMTMPHMTGDKLARELMTIRPNIPVILCTGHSRLVSEEKAQEIGIKAFVMKPLVMRNLAETVRKVLDAGRSEV